MLPSFKVALATYVIASTISTTLADQSHVKDMKMGLPSINKYRASLRDAFKKDLGLEYEFPELKYDEELAKIADGFTDKFCSNWKHGPNYRYMAFSKKEETMMRKRREEDDEEEKKRKQAGGQPEVTKVDLDRLETSEASFANKELLHPRATRVGCSDKPECSGENGKQKGVCLIGNPGSKKKSSSNGAALLGQPNGAALLVATIVLYLVK